MKIRQEQFDAISASRLAENIAAVVREDYANIIEGVDEQTVKEMIERGIGISKSFGFTAGEDIAAFVFMMFEIAPEFYKQPNIHAVLCDESVVSEMRMQALDDRTTAQDWEEARANIVDQRWFPVAEG